ncbi:MAG TPA: hypothetical protein VIJ14_10195 [Rhabdochlamydiaceae bacterium]
MHTQPPAASPLRRFEGLVARSQENMFLSQNLLRDVRSQLVKMRSGTAQDHKNTQRNGTWVQIVGHAAGIAVGALSGKPELYSMVSKSFDLFKALKFDTQGYDNQARMEEFQQEIAMMDMVHQTQVAYNQSLENTKGQIDQRKQTMFH